VISVDRLRSVKEELEVPSGAFTLFALLLRDDAPGVWDLVVSAPWLDRDQHAGLKRVADVVSAKLAREELVELSRIVILEAGNPVLEALLSAVNVSGGGVMRVRDSNLAGLQIKEAFILKAARPAPEDEAKAS